LEQVVNSPGATNWSDSPLSITINQEKTNTLRLTLSGSLQQQLRYRLTWTNVLDRFGNVGFGNRTFVGNPITDRPDFFCYPIKDDEGRRIGVRLIASFKTKLDPSSFTLANFQIEAAKQKKTVPIDDVTPEIQDNESRGTQWRSEVKLKWKGELPREDISVTWNNLKPQGEDAIEPLHETLVFKDSQKREK
jgi:hypothetical protein